MKMWSFHLRLAWARSHVDLYVGTPTQRNPRPPRHKRRDGFEMRVLKARTIRGRSMNCWAREDRRRTTSKKEPGVRCGGAIRSDRRCDLPCDIPTSLPIRTEAMSMGHGRSLATLAGPV